MCFACVMGDTPADRRRDLGPRDPEIVLTQRELRNRSGAIMRGLERGERYLITSNGVPVGELSPRGRRHFTPRAVVAQAFAGAPSVDLDRLRSDLDAHASQDVLPASEPDAGASRSRP